MLNCGHREFQRSLSLPEHGCKHSYAPDRHSLVFQVSSVLNSSRVPLCSSKSGPNPSSLALDFGVLRVSGMGYAMADILF